MQRLAPRTALSLHSHHSPSPALASAFEVVCPTVRCPLPAAAAAGRPEGSTTQALLLLLLMMKSPTESQGTRRWRMRTRKKRREKRRRGWAVGRHLLLLGAAVRGLQGGWLLEVILLPAASGAGDAPVLVGVNQDARTAGLLQGGMVVSTGCCGLIRTQCLRFLVCTCTKLISGCVCRMCVQEATCTHTAAGAA